MLSKNPFDISNKSVFVAGETGLVGQAVLRRLAQENVKIISASHKVLDLKNKVRTYDWLAAYKPDIVIMAAGKVGGIGANMADPEGFYDDNLAMAENVIHGSFQASVGQLIYLGSSCIYPCDTAQPIQEDALETGALEPTNAPYARAKIEGVRLCQKYRLENNCDYISVMPTNLYGQGDRYSAEKSHVIPAMILKIHAAKINKDPFVTLWGTGSPLREFLYIDDFADALIHVLKNYSDSAPINIGSGIEISIRELAKIIKNIIGYTGNIEFNPDYPDGIPRKLLDSTKLQNLGWRSQMPLDKGIEKTYQHFLNETKSSYASSKR